MAPSERFVDALNAQIDREYSAAHQYTAIAAWYEAETYPRLAAFFWAQADEERMHARKMTAYLLQAGQPVRLATWPARSTSSPTTSSRSGSRSNRSGGSRWRSAIWSTSP